MQNGHSRVTSSSFHDAKFRSQTSHDQISNYSPHKILSELLRISKKYNLDEISSMGSIFQSVLTNNLITNDVINAKSTACRSELTRNL